MCGNFGLLSLGTTVNTSENSSHHNESYHKPRVQQDELDMSVSASMHQVSKLNGIRVLNEDQIGEKEEMISPLTILEAQTACTEIRGGQAGGYSSIEYKYQKAEHQSHFDSMFSSSTVAVPIYNRVRMVARKRHPLAADLSQLYLTNRGGKVPDARSTITVIGHTRFATSSINKVSELHPHEWTPFHDEIIWNFNTTTGRFERQKLLFGVHISHNGDFDAMEAYSQTMVVDEIGLWLERVLHISNNTKGDSPKIAGCFDLMRVQGRWAASARLAWIRTILSANTDVSAGQQLSKSAPNSFPSQIFWEKWESFLDKQWGGHINNIVRVQSLGKFDLRNKFGYSIDNEAVKQFITVLIKELSSESKDIQSSYQINGWSQNKLYSFLYYTVRGFLRSDLYNTMTELLSRAEGSFGLQAHCTIEPGVVVIASKGQPMSIAFDSQNPIVLFASEAEALAVPVFKSGKWLSERIDLDSHGEIFRLGEPRALQEGTFMNGVKNTQQTLQAMNKTKDFPSIQLLKQQTTYQLSLDCGIEIRSYSLVSCQENSMANMIGRVVTISSAPIPYDPKVDLVANDLKVTTAVLDAIDHAWENPNSIERISGQSLAEHLVRSMMRRVKENKDTIDLIIAGVEVSLWLGEQMAADLRRVFPNLNVSTVSANKLLGVGDDNPSRVFFSGTDEILARRIDKQTCVLLISQSGQTFPTLHATRKIAKIIPGKVWILTGCFNSKMEQAIIESYQENHLLYKKNRVFNNYSGHRPAEPSSVAVAATWHTLTRFILHLIDVTRKRCPGGRIVHPWDYEYAAKLIQYYMQRYCDRKKIKQKFLIESEGGTSLEAASPNKVVLKKQLNDDYEEEADMDGIPMALSQFNSIISPPIPPQNTESEVDPFMHTRLAPFLKSKSEIPKISQKKSGDTSIIISGISPSKGVNFQNDSKPSKIIKQKSMTSKPRPASSKTYKVGQTAVSQPVIMMNLTDGCIADINSLLSENLIQNISQIVGYDKFGEKLPGDMTTHKTLIDQGKDWAKHINEPWHVLVFVGIYLIISVGLGLPVIGLFGDLILLIVRSAGADIPYGIFSFSPRIPHIMYDQPIGYTLIGLLLQILDAIFYIYIGKNITRLFRYFQGRPLAARHGKRTIVIVDSPCVHQLVEIFVSKLFSQSYSIVSVDVHGASGLDHFVHRFTHRVVRGVLLAIGRPDGRLCCLAKSEASVLLSAKQAAFIRNPDYNFEGSGPEIVTVGHNPFEPNLGLAKHIVLHGGYHTTASNSLALAMSSHHKSSHHKYHSDRERNLYNQHLDDFLQTCHNRRKFVDEYLYDRLFLAQKPFTVSILRSLRRTVEQGNQLVTHQSSTRRRSWLWGSSHGPDVSMHNRSRHGKSPIPITSSHSLMAAEPLPYGVHHIDPSILTSSSSIESSVFADFVLSNRELLNPKVLKDGISDIKHKSFDPAIRLAFSSKLDSQTRQIQDMQVHVQQFYECRIAALERYMAFCVMFHAMAVQCCKPWLLYPWDTARSQSNLRVATTASPISAGSADHAGSSQEVKKMAHQLGFQLRKVHVNF